MSRSRSYLPSLHGWAILLPVLLLCGISLATLLSMSRTETGLDTEKAVRQIGYMLAGLAAMFLTLTVDYRRYGEWSYGMFAAVIGVLVLLLVAKVVHIPFIPEVRGACRSIKLPYFSIQPSEVMKIVYVLALAYYLRYRRNYRTIGGLVGPFALTLLPTVLIVLEPDLGMSVLLLPVLFAMLFVAGARKRHLLPIVVAGLIAVPLMYQLLKPYQKARITVLMNQNDDDPRWRQGLGYQLFHAKTALGSGGWFGTGFSGPYVRHGFLPDRHNDFIFSIIGHQWGFFGLLLVLLCYVMLVVGGIEIATLTNDPFGRLLAVGLVVTIASQTLVNIGVTIGLMPTTGLTLPFVSFGGSSMLTNFVMIGLLLNIAQRRPILLARKPFEFVEG